MGVAITLLYSCDDVRRRRVVLTLVNFGRRRGTPNQGVFCSVAELIGASLWDRAVLAAARVR